MIGYETLLARINLDGNNAVPLWPPGWVEFRGGRCVRRPDAPEIAYVLPLAVSPAANFRLRSADQSEIFEVITPDLQDPAYIARWLAAPLLVGAQLLVNTTSASAAGYVDARFYFIPFNQGRSC